MSDIILLAVNDSRAGFVAADVAIEYARRLGDQLHAVCVVEPDSSELPIAVNDGVRRWAEADAMLRNVAARGSRAGVHITTHRRQGAVTAEILAASNELDAQLLVLALVDRPSHTAPSIGSHTLRVLEFATMAVLVVPVAASDR